MSAKIDKFLHKNWSQKTALSNLLLPFSLFYRFAFLYKKLNSKSKVFKPLVVCIGNITSGGNGKTQVEIELAQRLKQKHKVAFLTIGYKGKLQGPLLVTSSSKAEDVGEEALILQKVAPTCVAKNRLEGLSLLQEHGFDIVLMDDGYQNFNMVKDINILVVYGNYGFGNLRLIPAGPLREPLCFAVKRADIICVVDKTKDGEIKGIDPKKTLYTKYSIKNIESFDLTKNYLAFSALGFNEKFFNTLKESGFNLKHTISFKDHYFYKESDFEEIIKIANKQNLQIVTSSKDFIKVPLKYQSQIKEAKAKLEEDAINKIASIISYAVKK